VKLSKSWSSAVIMSSITVLSFCLVSAIENMLLPYLLTGDLQKIIAKPEKLNDTASLLALALFLVVVMLILIGIGAFWLYRYFGEAYYGLRGAFRWVLFGIFFAVLLQVPAWLFPKLPILKYIWQLLSLFVSFGLSRWFIPITRVRHMA
jgi:hypothetical protein